MTPAAPPPSLPRPTLGYRLSRWQQRRWLRQRGLLGRPWLILGAAPDPVIPAELPAGTAHVYVKYAGRAAAALGLPNGDLTFLLQKSGPAETRELVLDSVLRMGHRTPASALLRKLLPFAAGTEFPLTHQERDDFIIGTLGSLFAGVGKEKRPSNGVALICYAIAMGIPKIIVAGLSLEVDGYAYDPTARTRRHQPEDQAALARVAALYPQVVTTEPSLHRLTGLTLFEA
jgi:hypothetical protein